jgi:hypothetical protein
MAVREEARRRLMADVAQTREQQLAMQRAQRLAEHQQVWAVPDITEQPQVPGQAHRAGGGQRRGLHEPYGSSRGTSDRQLQA